MLQVTFKGSPVNLRGHFPENGDTARDFTLTKGDLSEVPLGKFAGKMKILSIVPSLDTSTCAASARKFNEEVSKLKNTVVLVISADLPFAQKRFCEAEGLTNIIALSSFRSSFPQDYGVEIAEGPLRGLHSRAVIIIDEHNKIIYTQQVAEITQEPDYEAALKALKKA